MSVTRHEKVGDEGEAVEARPARFLAWSNDGERIVATGRSFERARRAARAKGEPDPIVEQEPIPARRA